jgi:hypothetical protein
MYYRCSSAVCKFKGHRGAGLSRGSKNTQNTYMIDIPAKKNVFCPIND